MRTLFLSALLPVGLAATVAATVVQPPDREAGRERDRHAVEQAVYDYVDGLYQVDPGRIDRSVHRELAKRGFHSARPGGPYEESTMSFAQLRTLAERWNRARRVNPATAPREVVVLDLLDQTASAKLTAQWGVDYLHLGKYDGRWMIVNIVWQSPPPSPAAAR